MKRACLYQMFGSIVFLISIFCFQKTALAKTVLTENDLTQAVAEQEEEAMEVQLEDWMEWYPFEELDRELDLSFGGYTYSDLVSLLLKGNFSEAGEALKSMLWDTFFSELSEEKGALLRILLLSLVSALCTNLSLMIDRTEVTQVSFYIIYLWMVELLLQGFMVISDMVVQFTEQVTDFMKVVIPAMALSVGISCGQTTALGFGETGIFLLYLGEIAIQKCILPMIHLSVVLLLINHIMEEEVISKFGGLFQSFVQWFLKCFLGMVLGLNVVKGLLLPVIDRSEKNMAVRLVSLIPGADQISGLGSVFFSCASVMKNAMGVGFVVAICFLALIPCVKMLCFVASYKVLAAVVQPMTDKRIARCMDVVADGVFLLQRVLLTQVLFVVISVAILCMMT